MAAPWNGRESIERHVGSLITGGRNGTGVTYDVAVRGSQWRQVDGEPGKNLEPAGNFR